MTTICATRGRSGLPGRRRSCRSPTPGCSAEGSDLALSGDIPLDNGTNLNLRLNGTLNLAVLERIEKRLHLAGSTRIDVRATGSLREPQVIGQSQLLDARLDYGDLPFRFAGVRGGMVFSRNLVRLENIEGSVATGTIQLSGAVEHSIIRAARDKPPGRDPKSPPPLPEGFPLHDRRRSRAAGRARCAAPHRRRQRPAIGLPAGFQPAGAVRRSRDELRPGR